jgi:hypothetical protein
VGEKAGEEAGWRVFASRRRRESAERYARAFSRFQRIKREQYATCDFDSLLGVTPPRFSRLPSSGTATKVGALAMALPRRHDSSRLLLLGGFRGARRLIRGDGSLHVTFG